VTPREAIEHLIRDSIELGYRASALGVPMDEAQRGFLADPLADEGIRRAIAAVRQVGSS
jgi:hypothetical protein